MEGLLHKLGEKVEKGIHDALDDFKEHLGGGHHEEGQQQQDQHQGGSAQVQTSSGNRYQSFAPKSSGGVKWYVDGASYFWAVSIALEEARESICILDWWLSPELYLRRPPSRNEQYRLDNMLKAAAERGVQINVIVYKEVTQALTLDSKHTKHALEGLHPNIKVFRHPDHTPNVNDAKAELEASFGNLSVGSRLNAFKLSKVPGDALKALYGSAGDVVLYWAHHEKLCVVDNKIAFMGGLDMCFGRWDTNSHPIADAHPGNLDAIVFPGQDYNNARIYDFEGVDNWDHNKHIRNFIFDEKYNSKDPGKYTKVADSTGAKLTPERDGHLTGGFGDRMYGGVRRFAGEMGYGGEYGGHEQRRGEQNRSEHTSIQLCRSCTEWSAGHPTEHSIQNAYVDAISNARHFVYIENQFFITATSEEQKPVKNMIGRAIVDRIVRAHNAGEDFRVIVLMPAVPAFAGDLHSDDALGTRAIMEFQYDSINRGGYSIMESLQKQGVNDPRRYITFYNLRNYDRINTSSTMGRVEEESGVRYEDARREHDDMVGAGNYPYGEGSNVRDGGYGSQYDRYQRATESASDLTWDTVSACYMESGADLNRVPWQGSPESELDAYVSEELYIHSKVLIADDKLVICGSANLNDRSQLGNHDSEIAVVIEDHEHVESQMNGNPYRASKFATSLRRQLFRKHLGLLPDQRWDRPNRNWTPINQDPNEYDWGSSGDQLVADPMSPEFWDLWTRTARTNTEVFSKAFHNVPNDQVRTWDQYQDFFSRHFIIPGQEIKDEDKEGRVDYGHVVREEFPGGVDELKEWLGRIRGTLVEMPLEFLIDVDDLAKDGLSLNAFTDDIYT